MPPSLSNLVELTKINKTELTKKNANHSWKEKISNQNAILLILKIIDLFTDAKNAEKMQRVNE